MNRQEFEQEAALRLMPQFAGVTTPQDDAENMIAYIRAVSNKLYATSPTLFENGITPSAVSNGDKSGITVDELYGRSEISTRTRNIMKGTLKVEFLAELSGARWKTLRSYRGTGSNALLEINTALKKYGYEELK